MSFVKREDGIKFVIHTYREILNAKKNHKVKEEVRALSRDHGEYVRIFRKNDEQIEAVFSKEPGFLLAESIWHYFNRPADLIYCEALPDHVNALLVIIQRKNVYLDIKLPLSGIQDELASFMTGDNQYQIYVYGNVPVSDQFEAGKFPIPKEDLSTFTRIHESAFENLSIDESLQLQPLSLALRTQKLGKISSRPLLLTLSLLFFVGLGGWYWYAHDAKKSVLPPKRVTENPFSTYNEMLLSSAKMNFLFEEFSNLLAFSSGLPGWRISRIDYASNVYSVDVKPQSQLSSLQVLEKWLNQFGFKFVLKKESIQFLVASRAVKRNDVPHIADLDKTLMAVVDKLKSMLPMGAEIQIENEGKRVGLTHRAEVKIIFSSTSPDVLILLGRELLEFPAFVKEMNFSMDNNLLSGSLQLTVLGK